MLPNALHPHRFRFALAAFVVLATGCSTALSSFNTAHVPKKGGFHAEAGMDVSVPTGTLVRTVDAAETLVVAARGRGPGNEGRDLTVEEQLIIFDAGVNLALNPPAVIQHAGLAYAPLDRTEISLRYVGGGWRAGGRYQLWEQGVNASWDLAIGLSATRQSIAFPVDNVLDILRINDFERYTFDLPIAFGRRGTWYRIWGGPRLLVSTGSTQMTLTLPRSDTRHIATADSSGVYYGMQSGFAVGYKHVFVAFELNLVQFKGRADLTALGMSRSVSLDTFVVYPGIALLGEF